MWHLLTDNPQAVSRLYTKVPPLEYVSLIGISLHNDGPVAKIEFDLPNFPDIPPDRWKKSGFNTAQLHLELFVITKFSLEGWSNQLVVDVDIRRTGEGLISVTSQGANFNLNTQCQVIHIAHMIGYQNEKT